MYSLLFFFILIFKKFVFRQKMYFFRMGLYLPGLYGYSFFQQNYTAYMDISLPFCSVGLADYLPFDWLKITLPLLSTWFKCWHIPVYIFLWVISLHYPLGIYNKLSESKSLIKFYLSLLLPSRKHFLSIKHCIAILCHVMDSSQDFSKHCACIFMSFQLMEINRKIYRTRWAWFSLSFTE